MLFQRLFQRSVRLPNRPEDLLEENSPAALAGVTIPTLRQTTKRTAANFRHLNCFIGFASHSFFHSS